MSIYTAKKLTYTVCYDFSKSLLFAVPHTCICMHTAIEVGTMGGLIISMDKDLLKHGLRDVLHNSFCHYKSVRRTVNRDFKA